MVGLLKNINSTMHYLNTIRYVYRFARLCDHYFIKRSNYGTARLIVECCLKIIGPAARLNKQLPPKAMVNAILAGRALHRMKHAGMTPRGGLIKHDSGVTHETCTVVYSFISSDILASGKYTRCCVDLV